MSRSIRSFTHAAATALLLAALGGCTDVTSPVTPVLDDVPGLDVVASPGFDVDPFLVYNQNAYLGGDTGPLFTIDLSNIPLLLATTNTFWDQVTQSYVPERMAAIADQIAAHQPDVVSLEEVFQMAVVDATTGQVVDGADLLASLLGEIQARGLPYALAVENKLTSVTLPMTVDFTTFRITKALVVTDRIAVLRRTDVDVTNVTDGTYAANIPLTPDITVERGWIRVDLNRNGVPYHVIATHLETQGAVPIQTAQAAELVNSVAAGLDGVTILSGDFNSDAAGGPGDPQWTPTYESLLDAGFTDTWVQAGGPAHDPGFTCCHATDLRDPYPGTLDQRIDFVLVRDARNTSQSGQVSGATSFDILGTRPADRTSTHGLWYSDHAGVLAGLRLPKR
jgi:endonuclease/exonuclease/phosphatase family metal-dependent hydrolase